MMYDIETGRADIYFLTNLYLSTANSESLFLL